MAARTWEIEEVPALEAIRRAELDNTDAMRNVHDVLDSVVGPDRVGEVVMALADDGYLDMMIMTSGAGTRMPGPIKQLNAKGRRAIGQWPPEVDGYQEFLALIDQRLDNSNDVDRPKWQQLRDAVVAVGTGAGGTLVAQLVADMAHLIH